eukprot:CAMPEP_0175965888 /NCGR_PEP_ID=MMETSP0108-20121206/38359_1 /TAXON_ID=195067 ORGANISM="Goniomonas pacifica, Strain CCMP1869" /NCGR_SAMPLE_ID=MMETSP0108 /ASSEMBLY_ACC=CAM_ASM_000204 /LENGTH=172 /DNA_ID=CAMNT_0017294015 /DNA_START=29 /DNA_END=547 /DNA_ORIENTATION=-
MPNEVVDANDAVAYNACWRERIQKELQHLSFGGTFRMTSKSMVYYPEKPCNVRPPRPPSAKPSMQPPTASTTSGRIRPQSASVAESHARKREQDMEALREQISAQSKPPQERYENPQTSSQEYGWLHAPLMPRNKRTYRPLGSCDITAYAASVCAAQGVSPFARNRDASDPK